MQNSKRPLVSASERGFQVRSIDLPRRRKYGPKALGPQHLLNPRSASMTR